MLMGGDGDYSVGPHVRMLARNGNHVGLHAAIGVSKRFAIGGIRIRTGLVFMGENVNCDCSAGTVSMLGNRNEIVTQLRSSCSSGTTSRLSSHPCPFGACDQ